MATLGLVGREVRHFYLGLKEKGTITGRLSAVSNTEGTEGEMSLDYINRVQTLVPSGRLVMVTLSGSSIAMALGAVSFRTSLTQASRRWGSVVVWETVTPTCKKM